MSKSRLSILDRLEILEADIDSVLAENAVLKTENAVLKAENAELRARVDRLENPTPDNLMMGFLQSVK